MPGCQDDDDGDERRRCSYFAQDHNQDHDQQEQRQDNCNANNTEAARSNCSVGNGLKKLGNKSSGVWFL